jgi:integrase
LGYQQPQNSVKRWSATSVQNLVRHQSGTYYARTKSGGKQIWESLKTTHLFVAKARLTPFLTERREQDETKSAVAAGKMSFGALAELHIASLDENPELKPATRHYWRQVVKALLKSWPGLAEKDAKKITAAECKVWAKAFIKSGPSSTRFNNTVSALRHIFAHAVAAGARFSNPAATLERVKIRQKVPKLPARDQFLKLVSAIETAGAWCSRDCADFVRFLAFTGCRTGEAAEVTWADVDFANGRLLVRGDSETGTKNWTIRHVPLIPDAVVLLRRMRTARANEAASEKVLRVNEAQKAIDNAAKRVGVNRMKHHDSRHLFATTCIEGGVDIPTVSRWLGHKDGGALAMKTYGHLRDEHSQQAALRVSFEPAASNVVHMKGAA